MRRYASCLVSAQAGTASCQLLAPTRHRRPAVTWHKVQRCRSRRTSAGDDTGHLSSSAPRKVRTYSAGSRWSCAENGKRPRTAAAHTPR